jgi:U2-associated protein SR140
MWPRSPEERTRNRHTGFVCFMNRQDAEDAMDACSDADPFRVGRQLMMRWGKNVRKSADGIPIVKRGTGGTILPAKTDVDNQLVATTLRTAFHQVDSNKAIRVMIPTDKDRASLISTVASFVAKDGLQFEQILLQQERNNPKLNFLSVSSILDRDDNAKQDCIYYKWRVYSFCQGDGFYSWRTEPFVMIQPNGCTWYPPSLDLDAAQKEAEEVRIKEDAIRALKEQRRFQSNKRGLLTGRQLEQARRSGGDGTGTRLTDIELIEYSKLFKEQLCVSRESICQGMAFCFEKSGSAKQIASMIKELLMQTAPGTSLETICARLYLISDILYNSQQPGIRNAFLYRDAIEKMSPEMFKFLGAFSRNNFGRMSQERIGSAITGIFAAWTSWGVFDPIFINDLEANFDGREIVVPDIDNQMDKPESVVDDDVHDSGPISSMDDVKPRGDWTSVSGNDETTEKVVMDDITSGHLREDMDGQNFDDDDPDGEPLEEEEGDPTLDNCLSRNDVVDGVPLEENDLDGVPLEVNDDSDADGEPFDENLDGEPL